MLNTLKNYLSVEINNKMNNLLNLNKLNGNNLSQLLNVVSNPNNINNNLLNLKLNPLNKLYLNPLNNINNNLLNSNSNPLNNFNLNSLNNSYFNPLNNISNVNLNNNFENKNSTDKNKSIFKDVTFKSKLDKETIKKIKQNKLVKEFQIIGKKLIGKMQSTRCGLGYGLSSKIKDKTNFFSLIGWEFGEFNKTFTLTGYDRASSPSLPSDKENLLDDLTTHKFEICLKFS